MKYLPPQDYTTPPKLFSWPNMAIIPKVTRNLGLLLKPGFVSHRQEDRRGFNPKSAYFHPIHPWSINFALTVWDIDSLSA